MYRNLFFYTEKPECSPMNNPSSRLPNLFAIQVLRGSLQLDLSTLAVKS